VITGAEAGAAVKASAGIVSSLQKGITADEKWPSVHEALMELYAILDDWCEAAANANEVAELQLEARLNGMEYESWKDQRFSASNVAPPGILGLNDYIKQNSRDITSILSPNPPWVRRWRASKRRAAGRRTLETILNIYEPELLSAFKKAVDDRSEWVKAHRTEFDRGCKSDKTSEELASQLEVMENTLQALVQTRESLLSLIRAKYPLGPI
jgi:hypothetical protein